MQKLQGDSGDGIGALGLKKRDDGRFDLMMVDTVMQGEAPFLRKAGMGGARYTRHCLESIVLERGGLWMPETVSTSFDILEKIDAGHVAQATFETWTYVADGDAVRRQSVRASTPMADAALQHRKFIEKDIDWPALMEQTAAQAAEELEHASLKDLWVTRYASALDDYLATGMDQGRMLCALLARQAVAERIFLRETAASGAFNTQHYLTMIGARYVRTLCLLDLCAKGNGDDMLRMPDLTEAGRTILLLAAAGRIPEASELGVRLLSHLGETTPFVPMVPLFALAWATGRDDMMANPERDGFGTTLQDDLRRVLAHIRGEDHDPDTVVARIIDARMRQMGGFSDEYHIDYDDGLSWAMPYEAMAIRQICAFTKRPVPSPDHPALALPTAQIPDLQGQQLPFQDIYARFLETRKAAS